MQTKTKIDHVFCSTEWGLLFPQCHLRALSSSVSDHCAMVLTGQTSQRQFKGFRFENYWLRMRGFDAVVQDSWSAPCPHSDAMMILHNKLLRLARALRHWSRKNIGNVALLSAIADQLILGLDQAQDHRDLTLAEIGLRQHLKMKLLGLAAIQRIRIWQRSRILWLRAGDADSKLFHIKANGRRRRNFIPLLQTDDSQLTTMVDKHRELHRHFSATIGTPKTRQCSLNWNLLDLPRLDLSSLDEQFSEEEIKKAVFALPSGKAPGPDGYTADCFKRCWEVIKHDVSAALHQFFALRGKHFHLLNTAYITLLPKSNEAIKVKDFRPISLIHSVRKIAGKLLSIRLALFLQQLIPPSQSAFIKSRSIHDNFLFVKNAIRSLHQHKDPALLLKMDIAGAFDNISWSFLMELFSHMGFGHKWCDMVSLLWSTASSRVMANGELGPPFIHRQGLRQGDPLSPMIFTLAIAPLHWLFAKAADAQLLTPLRLPPSQLRVSLYADDAALFISPKATDIKLTKEILGCFGSASGLVCNMQKSGFFPICCDDIDLVSLLQQFPVPVLQFPCTYLGLLLHYKSITRADIQPILDKLASRLQKWRGKLMTGDARLRLINSVLSSIPVYLITIFKLGAWAIKQIDKLRRNFLWRSKPDAEGGLALVNWSIVCRPKSLGGLGVIDLKRFGRALRLRWKWLEWRDQDRPWIGSPIPCDKDDLALFAAATNISIGAGTRVKFWHDRWLAGDAPGQIAPDLLRLCYRKNLTVEKALNGQHWLSGLHRISSESEMRQFTNLWARLRNIVLDPARHDEITWNRNAAAAYTTSSAYRCQFLGSFAVANYDKLWKSKVEAKCRFFFWLFLKGKILTNDNLAKRGIPHGPKCALCDQSEESALHLIIQCPFARSTWLLVGDWQDLPALMRAAQQASSIVNWWNDHICPLGAKAINTAIYTGWNIWKERNRRVFEKHVQHEDELLNLIKQDILQPMLSFHWTSDTQNSPEPEPD